MQVELIDKKYKWKHLTLSEFLTEGNIPNKWTDFFLRDDVQSVLNKISEELKEEKRYIFPCINHVFRAFYLTDIDSIKLVICGQDVYATPVNNTSAVGLAFSVKRGNTINSSLRNIYNELKNEGYKVEETGELFHWAKQGVFLINAALTVAAGKPGSHSSVWKEFHNLLVDYLVNNIQGLCWLLMGKDAQRIKDRITNPSHGVFCTSHPSFFSYRVTTRTSQALCGSNIFKEINNYLKERKIKEINW